MNKILEEGIEKKRHLPSIPVLPLPQCVIAPGCAHLIQERKTASSGKLLGDFLTNGLNHMLHSRQRAI